VTVTATETLTISGTAPDGTHSSGIFAGAAGTGAGAGSAGNLVVQAPRVTLTGGAQINSVTSGPGKGGTVMVTATETLSLSGTVPRPSGGMAPSGIVAGAAETAAGAGSAGNIVVQAPQVILTDGAQIIGSSLGPGQGGSVTVTAENALTITGRDSGLRATASGSGRGGDIAIQAHQLQLTDGASLTAESTGTGNAGNVTITTQDSFLSTHGTVVTRATQADGGDIKITAANFLRLRDSAITASVGGGQQTVGGNITIDPRFILLQNSQIVARAFEGQGGKILLRAQQAFLADPASTVSASASSKLGINGLVDIQSPVKSITGALAPLPQAFARTTELLRNRCAERVREGTVSRFVLGGRDGVPLEPGSWLPSALESMDQQPPAPSAQAPQARRSDSGEGLHIDNAGQERVRGQYAQVRWPDGLDVECARWLGQQRTR
jgi:large exoprotein involved in heme utilization and adhesion